MSDSQGGNRTVGSSKLLAENHNLAETGPKPSPAIPNTNLSQRRGRMTGPRTTAGKNRSRYNAVKAGIFSRAVVLKDESLTDYEALLTGYRDHFQPQGTFENSLVDKLAMLDWRRKRLVCAERAEIESSIRFKSLDLMTAQKLEAWDALRMADTDGGTLRHESNPYVVRDALEILTQFRDIFEKTGFEKGYDFWVLRKLYGLDRAGAAPFGFLQSLVALSKIAAEFQKEHKSSRPDDWKQYAIDLVDNEINRLRTWQDVHERLNHLRREYAATAALVPDQDKMEKFVRYEAHLSREFDRTLNQLERCQRMRLGQPVAPTIKVDVTS